MKRDARKEGTKLTNPKVSEWVATEILQADSPRTRLAVLKNFIDIAEVSFPFFSLQDQPLTD